MILVIYNKNLCIPDVVACVRVCWSLFSDHTVDCCELYHRPVLEDTPADSSGAPHGRIPSSVFLHLQCR